MHLKYDNMHKNIMSYDLICINNHIITGMIYMLSLYPIYVILEIPWLGIHKS